MAAASSRARHWLDRAESLARLSHRAEARTAFGEASRCIREHALGTRWQLELVMVEASLLYFDGELDASIPPLLHAREQAERAGLPDLAAGCAAQAALHMQQSGRAEDAVHHALEALRTAPPTAHKARYRACLALATHCDAAGLAPQAGRLYQVAIDEARAAGDARGFGATLGRMACEQAKHAMHAALLGMLDPERLKQAVVGMRTNIAWQQGDDLAPYALDHVQLGMLLWLQGHHAEAEGLLGTWYPLSRQPESPFQEADAAAALARCRSARGDHAAAADLVRHALRVAPVGASVRDLVRRAHMLNNAAEVLAAAAEPDANAVAMAAQAALTETARSQAYWHARIGPHLAREPLLSLLHG